MYDAFGNRAAKTVNGVTTQYLLEDDKNPTGCPQVFDELINRVVTRTYAYGLQRIDQAQVVNSAWMTSFYGYDGDRGTRKQTGRSQGKESGDKVPGIEGWPPATDCA